MNKPTIIIFSPGFGIRKGTYNLFEKIRTTLGNETIRYEESDYCHYDEDTKEVSVLPFSAQQQILQELIENTKKNNPDARLIIIAQSQGCFISALCDISSVDKVIMISPFFYTDQETVMRKYVEDRGTEINLDGTTYRKRSDGTTTVIPLLYWTERFASDIVMTYNDAALRTDITLFYGLQDRVTQFSDHHQLKNMYLMNLDGDHDFRGEPGDVLMERIKQIVAL